MAARTSTSIGIGITITLLGIATLALFVTTIIFYSSLRTERKNFQSFQESVKDIVRDEERTQDRVQQIKKRAQDERKSVLTYLIDSQAESMQLATGSRGDTVDDLKQKMTASKGGPSLLSALRDRDSRLTGLEQRLADAEAARARALEDKENEVARVGALEEAQRQTLAALNTDVGRYKDEVDQLRDQINGLRSDMDSRVDRIRDEGDANEQQLRADIDRQQRESVLDKALIARLQGELKGQRYTGQAEEALVDGQVIGLDAAEGTVFINLGRKDKAVLGMAFAVYDEPSAIRPDPLTNEYPRGKAALEIIKVDENSSTCRVRGARSGNPVVRGDVIASAVYDPNKKYRFVIYGNFDTDGDGRATPFEQADVKARITAWGGEVLEELSGDVDFLVLGTKPVLPPEPSGTAPFEVVQDYIRQRRLANRYDELFNQATTTSIPILNENRLRTLTGQ